MDLNHRPYPYQGYALADWAIDPKSSEKFYITISHNYFKEVIQPQVPLRLPCYDFTPVMNHTVVSVPPKVRLSASGATHSHGVTGGVYKARERIHRGVLIRDY